MYPQYLFFKCTGGRGVKNRSVLPSNLLELQSQLTKIPQTISVRDKTCNNYWFPHSAWSIAIWMQINFPICRWLRPLKRIYFQRSTTFHWFLPQRHPQQVYFKVSKCETWPLSTSKNESSHRLELGDWHSVESISTHC